MLDPLIGVQAMRLILDMIMGMVIRLWFIMAAPVFTVQGIMAHIVDTAGITILEGRFALA